MFPMSRAGLLLLLLLLPAAGRALGEALRPQYPKASCKASGSRPGSSLDRLRWKAPRGGGGGGGLAATATPMDLDQRSRRAGSVVAVSAALGSLLQGFDTGIIGGALLFIIPEFQLADRPYLQGLMVTSSTMGAIGGTVLASKLSDAIGRRSTLLSASSLFITSSLLMAWAPNVNVLLGARAMMGLAIGQASSVVPVYIAECADAKQRGALATIPQLCISSGIMLAYTVAFVATMLNKSWRLMVGLALVPSLLQCLCLLMLPESPRWLLSRAKTPEDRDKALHALAWLRGVKDQPDLVAQELATIEEGLQQTAPRTTDKAAAEARGPRQGWGALLHEKALRQRLAVCMTLQMFQQVTGINAVVYFTPQILKEAGVPQLFSRIGLTENSASLLATALAYMPKIPALFFAMSLMDRMGRRRLLQVFVPLMGVCLASLCSVFSFMQPGAAIPGVVALISICLYGSFFVLSLGPIPNIISAELFPLRARSAAMAGSLGSQFVFNTLVGMV